MRQALIAIKKAGELCLIGGARKKRGGEFIKAPALRDLPANWHMEGQNQIDTRCVHEMYIDVNVMLN